MARKTSTSKMAVIPEASDVIDISIVNEVETSEPAELGPQIPVIPAAKRPPKQGVERSMIWLYGDNGVGKSTLASTFPGVWFWSTEPGQDFIETYEPHMIHSWEHFLTTCKWVEETKPAKIGKEKLQYICIDTVDLLFKMCSDDVCNGLGIEDPSELGHGKAWARLNAEFERVMSKLRRWPYGFILISHQRDREVSVRARKITRIEPDIGAAGRRVLGGLSDFIFYCCIKDIVVKDAAGTITGEIGEQRIIRLHPTPNVIGKTRKSDTVSEVEMSYTALMDALK